VRGRSVSIALLESRASVNAHGLSAVTDTVLESSGVIVSGHVPIATHEVVSVFTPFRRVVSWLASAETEFRIGHEVRPFMYLLERSESRRKNESANGISISVCPMRI
jgi:hypothetical protein